MGTLRATGREMPARSRPEWIDPNGHMSMGNYLVVFDYSDNGHRQPHSRSLEGRHPLPTPQPLPVMSRMQLTLGLPEGKRTTRITIVGVVVRCAEVRGRRGLPFDAAIFFEDVSPASARNRLNEFVGSYTAPA